VYIYGSMGKAQRWYFCYLGAILTFLPHRGDIAPMDVKFGVDSSAPNFIPSVQGWVVGPKTENSMYPISEYKRPVGAYPLGDSYEIFR